MDASTEAAPVVRINPGSFSRACVENEVGEVEVRLSSYGNWMVHVRRVGEADWRIACSGDLESGSSASASAALGIDTFALGDLMIHRPGRRVFVAGEEVPLSIKEFRLLLMLATDPHRVFTKAELLKSVWGFLPERTRTLDTHASRLRRKLLAAGAHGLIINAWGVGYKLCDPVPVGPTTSRRSGVTDDAPAA